MNNKALLNLTYLADEKDEFDYDKIIFNNSEYNIDEPKTIELDFDDFETEMGSKVVIGKFIDNQLKETTYRYFEVISGENKGFLFPSKGYTRDIIFPDNSVHELEIIYKKKSIYKGNFSKRLLLINTSETYGIIIDKIVVTQYLCYSAKGDSAQVVAYDLKNRIFCYKEISKINYKKFEDFYELKKTDAEHFFKSIKNLVNQPINLVDCNLFKEKINDDKLVDLFLLKLNIPKSIASNRYDKVEYFEFISNCSLYYIFYYLKDKIKDSKDFASIFKYFNDFKKKIENDSSLNNYNKGIVIMEFSYWMKNSNNIDNFKNIKFDYFVRNNCGKHSILKSALLFLESFIEIMDDKNPFLEPLIFIDSGNYIYNNDNAYGYGLISKELLKSHLKNIIPEVIFVYNDINAIEDIAFSNKANGAVELNLASNFLSQINDISLNKDIEDDEIRENLSLKLVLIFLHEVFGHKKGGFSTRGDFLNSPRIFFNKEKNSIMKLCNRYSLEKGDNYIKIIRGNNSDSGNFLEYFLGENDCGYVSEQMEIMMENNVDLHFLFNNDLWNEKIGTLREYIYMKYLVFSHCPESLNNTKFKTLDEEIVYLKETKNKIKIDIHKIVESMNKQIKSSNSNNITVDNAILKKVNSILSSSNKNLVNEYYKNYEKLSSEILQENLKDSNISNEAKKIIREILFSRIIKK